MPRLNGSGTPQRGVRYLLQQLRDARPACGHQIDRLWERCQTVIKTSVWAVGAVASADALHAFGRGFESLTAHHFPAHRTPEAIMDEIAALDAESAEVLGNIRELP